MQSEQPVFIFSHPPEHPLAQAAWDAAMTAGLLGQTVTLLFSGNGLKQLDCDEMMEKARSFQELFPVQLCAETDDARHKDTVQLIAPSSSADFLRGFHRVLSF